MKLFIFAINGFLLEGNLRSPTVYFDKLFLLFTLPNSEMSSIRSLCHGQFVVRDLIMFTCVSLNETLLLRRSRNFKI